MELPPQIKIKENSTIARLAAWKLGGSNVAIVFGNTIRLHGVSKSQFLKDTRWLRHELKHVEQYKQNGFLSFLIKYMAEWVKNGYYNNRFEVEARAAEMPSENS